jgi:Fur family ferric uptake transcriptional regulator
MKFDFGQHKSRYELASEFDSARHKHNHIICTNCGKIVNYTDYAAEESLAMQSKRIALEKKYSFNIKQHQLQYFGECKKCTIRRAA